MASLVHEIWEEISDGVALHTCCLAGPRGEDCRRNLAASAQLLTTFEAGSHYDAMSQYHRYLNREPYSTDQDWDRQPYPDEWLDQQRQPQ